MKQSKKEALKEIDEFLRESNAIEGVYDADSLHQAHIAWQYLMKKDVLTVGLILKVHKILMLHQNLRPDEKGYLRTVQVFIGPHLAMNPAVVPMFLQQWCFESMRAYPPVDPIALHVEYEKIHPFVDGNGRTGRMLMNWTRLKRTHEPLLIIKESEKQEYYKWFR